MVMAWDPSQAHSIERLQVIYKIAERCNLNCSYCYYYNMGDDTAFQRPARVSLSATTSLARWLAQGCTDLDIPELLISFHGGEPMLLRALEFARMCDTLLRIVTPATDLRFSIQTNGTVMTEGWLEALKRYQVSVGVSIDGRRTDHDRFRLDHRGRSSFKTTETTIKRLMDESINYPHLRPGTISVLHHEVDYRETYRYLRELGVQSMHFLLPDRSADDRTPDVEAKASAIGQGLLAIFEEWMTEDNPDINIRFISETLGHFQIGGPQLPLRRRRKTNQILVARSDLTIAIDDSLIPALEWYKKIPVFPIAQYTLRDVFRDPIFRLLEEEVNRLPDGCAGCPWTKICRGGDLENRYSKSRGFNNPSVYCATYKILYRGICDLLVKNGYPEPEINLRFGGLAHA
ncbi:MAG TPA: radical SAM protein [Pyrinomonadaceae bacterium]|nr:radical SAM protein [Pyrinomonadaceae bacterium]